MAVVALEGQCARLLATDHRTEEVEGVSLEVLLPESSDRKEQRLLVVGYLSRHETRVGQQAVEVLVVASGEEEGDVAVDKVHGLRHLLEVQLAHHRELGTIADSLREMAHSLHQGISIGLGHIMIAEEHHDAVSPRGLLEELEVVLIATVEWQEVGDILLIRLTRQQQCQHHCQHTQRQPSQQAVATQPVIYPQYQFRHLPLSSSIFF